MKTNSNSKKLIGTAAISVAMLAMVAWMTPGNYYQMAMENDFLKSLKKKISSYNEQMPEDRVYVQFDKPMYEPGETIWFSAFVRDGQTLKPSGKSDIVHVQLMSPKGSVERTINLIAKNGVAAGEFSLDKEALGGMYKVRAYTNWMKNEGEDKCFEKEIQVQDVVLPNLKMKLNFERKAFGTGDEVIAKLELNTNENKPLSDYKIKYVANLNGEKIVEKADITDEEGMKFIKFNLPKELKTNDGLLNVMIDYNGSTESISRSIPIVLNKIALQLFPEGGDLVSGLESNVAFRALNEFGKPADVEGFVMNEKGSVISSFSSYHQGMGAFKITPSASEKYLVKITKPEGIKETYSLPEVLGRGYVMSVDNSKNNEMAAVLKTTENEELSLVAQVRGKIYYSTALEAKKGENKVVFPTGNFPIGVSQITLFDSKGIARAERLAFVNKDKQLSISIETDKEKYQPREKVKMTISVKDERGIPMPATIAVAVANDQFLSFADDKSGNILSQLLLQQDIKEKVEEPAFYFDKKEKKADQALDYLLMTAGWRRYTWEKIDAENIPAVSYAGEKAIVSGMVMDANTGKPLANAKIKIAGGAEYATDENGKFIFNKLDLSAPVNLTFNADGFYAQSQYVNQYNQNLITYLYKPYNYYGYNTNTKSRAKFDEDIIDIPMPASNAGVADMMEVQAQEELMPMKKAPMGAGEGKKGGKVQNERLANKVAQPDASKVVMKEKEKAEKDAKNISSKTGDLRGDRFRNAESNAIADDEDGNMVAQNNGAMYYRAKQFAAPAYDKNENVEVRTDFRNTVYWNPTVEIDKSGKKTVEFYMSDDITSFRATAEGLAADGGIGRGEKVCFTQLPFAMTTKIPVEVATEDNVSIPLTLKNNTDKPLGGVLTITAPNGLEEIIKVPSVQTIMPGKAKVIYLDYKVLDKIGTGEFTIAFKACGLGDAFSQKIKIAPKGFPVNASYSSQDKDGGFSFEINKLVNGSLKMNLTAFPNVVSDLMKGVEGILREPYGCFEQTSCSAYPNAMVLDYLKSTDSKDDKTIAYAGNLLDKGYNRLTTFECKGNGYEWFGANPAHEGLTAYGIMEFVDMKKAGGNVSQKMIDNTAQWLMKQKDGNGGFKREKHAYHDFGRISDDILNSYIVYALTEAGFTDLKKEFEASYKKAMDTKDPYMLAMMANAAYSMKENSKGDAAMEALVSKQAKDGSWNGLTHSITYSQGQSLIIETTSLGILASLKSGKNVGAMQNAVQYLTSTRSGSGVFSSTQGTILALKALTEYAKFSKKTNEDGTIEVYVDGKKAGEKSYKAGEKGAITMDGLEEFVKGEGKHDVKVKFVGAKNALPYSVAVNWNTTLPVSDKDCAIDLKTKLASKTANVGETVRLATTITNKTSKEVPSTMAIIGIPAGFTVQPWQLKELQEKNVFDYYEIMGNNIAIYYRGMGANEVHEINLDLKAEMPGEYDAPASSAYLYYTNEFKTWSAVDKVTIKKNSI